MEKTNTTFPFSIKFEEKISKKGNEYMAIRLSRSYKDNAGERKWENINLIDKRDLLVMANLCSNTFAEINTFEQNEFQKKMADNPTDGDDFIEDELPF